MTRASVCLSMIVKDEAAGIAITLQSAKDAGIDHWVILDTRSTDGTQEIVREVLRGVPGELVEGAFTNFADTRNRALDLCAGRADWILLLSGDDYLHPPATDLGKWLGQFGADAHDALVGCGELEHCQVRLVRAGSDWRYRGLTHEKFEGSGLGIRSPLTITALPGRAKRERWLADLEILVKQVELEPNEPRWIFYLAQTHQALGNLRRAHHLYAERYNYSDGDPEERWQACLRAGMLASGFAAASWLSRAHSERPDRAEPLYYLAKLYEREPKLAAYELAALAASKKKPAGARHLVDAGIYERRARELLERLRG